MSFTANWRNFKRMEDLTAVAAGLVYAAALLSAFARHDEGLAEAILLWPLLHFAAAFLVPTRWPMLRRWLARYVWMSFCAGFGQTVVSVLIGALFMGWAGMVIFHEVEVAADALSLAPMFCAFAAGVGILAAQALLVRRLEQLPDVRAIIQRP